ncbi:putative yyaK [Gossypium arboreum]|uniref:Putative yyaK n=1 Tax=Gossypium arboreum TaxID=29729 RepID=A0A0B0NTL0_GOSAR|nr:putative yyaK [Gossypium arboreum]
MNSGSDSLKGASTLILKLEPAMGLLTINCGMFVRYYGIKELSPRNSIISTKFSARAFASRKPMKKSRREGRPSKSFTLQTKETLPEDINGLADMHPSKDGNTNNGKSVDSTPPDIISIPSRSTVLQACTITSGLIAALGLIIRQFNMIKSPNQYRMLGRWKDYPFLTAPRKYHWKKLHKVLALALLVEWHSVVWSAVGFELWHLELITGLVLIISSCRYILLKTWRYFAESSDTANKQILSSLQPYDYLVVAFLPGMSEELLFRGALLPVLGFDWKSVIVVSTLFGVLHLGNGRKYSFAVWATFVGIVYGYATIMSSSVIVPMASHALNNLVGGLLWRYTSKSLE